MAVVRISEQTVRDTLHTIIREMPDATNPVDDSEACLYTGEDGTHCIAGEVCVRLGVDMSLLVESFKFSQSNAVELFTEDAVKLLDQVQHQADNQCTWDKLHAPYLKGATQ